MLTEGRLAGSVALITGAAGGIGAAIAARFVAEGAWVSIADRADATGLAAELGERAVAEQVDLADRARRDGLVGRVIERWGRLDILVNNAADHGARTPLSDVDYPDWDAVLETNLTATTFLSRQAAAAMGERGGAIVNIASIQQRLPLPDYAAYIASKGGISAITKVLALELAPAVRVNEVAPGVIATDSFRNTPGAQQIDRRRPATLLGRTGRADEVAGAVSFLASADASFITGATLTVDGGRTLSRRADPLAE